MEYKELNPQPIMGLNTRGVGMLIDVINNNDPCWLTQVNSSLYGWGCPCGNGYHAALLAHSSEKDKRFYEESKQAVSKFCAAVLEFITKDYDMRVSWIVEEEKAITVEVPRVRKVGLFRKEEYVERETRVVRDERLENVTYKGWRIERLWRKEFYVDGTPCNTLFMDYCLGADGRLYLVVTESDKLKEEPLVLQCVCFSPGGVINKFCNVHNAAISGALGALDAIPIEESDPLRNVRTRLSDDYEHYYNYPIQIDDTTSFAYGFLSGTAKRVANLLSDDEKIRCCEKYEWTSCILFP